MHREVRGNAARGSPNSAALASGGSPAGASAVPVHAQAWMTLQIGERGYFVAGT